jgi:hypothetical protein
VREPAEAGEAHEHHRPGRGFWDGLCLRTINTFGGMNALPWEHLPKEFLSNAEYPIKPVGDIIKPFSAGTWPYDRVFRREEADEDTPE